MLELEGIVPGLLQGVGPPIRRLDGGVGVAQVAQDQGFALLGGRQGARQGAGPEHVEHQHREVAGEGPAAFAHQGGHGDAVGLAALLHRCHHVVGVVLQGVVGGGGTGGAAAVVVDAQAAPHVEIAHRRPQARQFGVDLASLLQGVFEHGDVVDLAADVEVQQAQLTEQVGGPQGLHAGEQIRHREPKLGPLPHRAAPAPRTAGRELGADAEQGGGTEFAAGGDDPPHLIGLLDHHHRLTAQAPGQDRRFDVALVFIAVADQQGFRVV